MKGLKITNLVLFTLFCACQAFILYVFVACVKPIITRDAGGILGAILGLLPIFIVAILATCVICIILTITTKKLITKKQAQSLPLSTFDKTCKKLPLILIIINIIMLVAIFVLAKATN